MRDSLETAAKIRSGIPCRRFFLCCLLPALGLLLYGCEAPLDLSGVRAQAQLPVQRADLFQAAARHGDKVVVVGGMGTVVQSGDRGESWQRTTLDGNAFLVDVTACPDGRFHAIDKTDGLWSLASNGGWTRAALPEMTEPQAMDCDAENRIWVVGGFATILNSQDVGANWESWSLDEDLYLTSIQFIDRENAVATGEFGTVLVTGDGGESWSRASELPNAFYPQAAYFRDSETGWVVGLDGIIWKTEDGGDTWRQAPSGVSTPLYGITGTEQALVAVGDNTTILHKEPGDGFWSQLDQATRSLTYLRAVAGLGNGEFVVAGGGTLFQISPLDIKAATGQGTAGE